MMTRQLLHTVVIGSLVSIALLFAHPVISGGKQIAYLTAKSDLPFWNTLGKGIKAVAEANGYTYLEMDSNLSGRTQLENARAVIAKGVAGIVISPTDSKTAPEVLELAMNAKVPVANQTVFGNEAK